MARLKAPRPHPKHGATKAQAKRYQAERALKNQIFELEKVNEDLVRQNGALRENLRRLSLRPPLAEMHHVLRMPYEETVRLGLTSPLYALHCYARELDTVASGKAAP
jgi:hypothetical protein